jgi:hypothetical protein
MAKPTATIPPPTMNKSHLIAASEKLQLNVRQQSADDGFSGSNNILPAPLGPRGNFRVPGAL